MATTKKSTSAKKKSVSSSTTKPKTRAVSTAKSAAKAPAKRRSQASRKRVVKVQPDERPFMTFKITRQTIYWGVVSAMVLALGLWVLDINDKVMYIYDQIEMSQLEMSDLELKEIQESKSRKQ